MNDKTKTAIGWFATALVSIVLGVFALSGSEPIWWAAAVGILVPLVSALIGKPWKPPEA
jgi:apolipoprotein N-acyltransferase